MSIYDINIQECEHSQTFPFGFQLRYQSKLLNSMLALKSGLKILASKFKCQPQLFSNIPFRMFCYQTNEDQLLKEERIKQNLEKEAQERLVLEKQMEQKERFDELFSILTEKKQNQTRIFRLYKFYSKRYKREKMNLKIFILLNLVLLIAALIIPGKEFPIQKGFQMKVVLLMKEMINLLKQHEIISGKRQIELLIMSLKYLERNDIFDLDFIISIIHAISLSISQSEHQEKCLMILGSGISITQLLKEFIEVRPHTILEKDFQEVLLDYFELFTLSAEDLSSMRRDFLYKKSNLLNSDQYYYYVLNQIEFSKLGAMLLVYNKNDKQMIYNCLLRMCKANLDYDELLKHFLDNSRMQIYQDIAGKNEKDKESQQISIELAKLLFQNKACRKQLISDKLLSNMIKLFIIKLENKHVTIIQDIIQSVSSDKELMNLQGTQAFKAEFDELKNLSKQKQTQDLLKPLFSTK